MNELITISGVRGFIDEQGIAYLNLEDVAQDLGFTRVAASGNEVVQWDRVARFLLSFKACEEVCTNLGKTIQEQLPEYIPENIFYRLAMKAKNQEPKHFRLK